MAGYQTCIPYRRPMQLRRGNRARNTRVEGDVTAPQKARNPSVRVRQAEPMWGQAFWLAAGFSAGVLRAGAGGRTPGKSPAASQKA